jgi:type III restriction enzyme
MFTLKPYQHKTLEALETYLGAARILGPKTAFQNFVQENPTDPGNQHYRNCCGLEHVPYVCLRLPTGGGKTCLAAHSVAVAGRAFLEKDFPTVLWLVPTNAIRTQTLEALKKPDHPYREALDNAYDGRVRVFDISEVEQIRPKDLLESVCVIVGTLATLRVQNTDGRRIYAHNENFEPHFAILRGDDPALERFADGAVKYSFVNVLHQLQPLIIMDEAHKAKTELSNDVVLRVNPACVIEFTATPIGSNILFRVTASELKAEEMIKLPIIVTEHGNWQAAVRETVLTRNGLEEKATHDHDGYIRPIALIQAESVAGKATLEAIKAHLVENEKVEEQAIAIATGSQRDLEGEDLFDPKCPIRYVITIQALKEGWDCPFAYVFCSTANIKSAVDVEQLLGRVLRMPYAKRRMVPELNLAYAHVISPGFAVAAGELQHCLTNMGFQDEEAEENIRPAQPKIPGLEEFPLFQTGGQGPLVFVVQTKPDLSVFTPEHASRVAVEPQPEGGFSVQVTGTIDDDFAEKIITATPKAERDGVRRVVAIHRFASRTERSPAERGMGFSVPRLCMLVQGMLEPLEKENIFGDAGWDLLAYPAEFTGR